MNVVRVDRFPRALEIWAVNSTSVMVYFSLVIRGRGDMLIQRFEKIVACLLVGGLNVAFLLVGSVPLGEIRDQGIVHGNDDGEPVNSPTPTCAC